MSSLVAEPKSRTEIMIYARLIRKLSGISEGYFDIIRFIEHNAMDVLGLDFEIVSEDSDKLESNEYAKFVPAENKIDVRQRVYYGAADGNGQDRFTLAHELGHALFHKRQALSRSAYKPPAYKDPEWQANEFASHVLCPIGEIEEMSIDEVCGKYKVSKQVAEIQRRKRRVILCEK